MSIRKRNIETIKNIIIGFLIGALAALWMSLLRVCIEKDALEDMMAPPSPPKIKREVPKDYERAKRIMPIVPASPLTEEELLSLASMFPEVFTDEEIVTLLAE
jgi:hypothetical protein